VSEDKRIRVDAAVKKLGYVPDLAASRLASSRTHTIGVIVPTLYNVIFADYLSALHEYLICEGLQVVVVNSRYSKAEEENAVKTLIGQRVEAIVIAGVDHTPLARRLLAQSRIPVIETLELTEDPVGLNIGFPQQSAGADATEHLIARGCRRIAFFHGNLDDRAAARLAGYRRAMTEAGLEDGMTVTAMPDLSSIRLGSALLARLAESTPLPDALFCVDDNVALGALQECRKRGIRVPQDMAIIGFHDLEFAQCLSPGLTTVATRRYETGRLAAEKLVAALTGGVMLRPERIDLGYELIGRESTGA
jgi:LacI family gluconate utilization system Gnt-I transcriptional repressor